MSSLLFRLKMHDGLVLRVEKICVSNPLRGSGVDGSNRVFNSGVSRLPAPSEKDRRAMI